jgi:hypothetical protein
MASKTPGGGGGLGRGSSGSGGGGGKKPPVKPITNIKTKKPLSKVEMKKREDAAKKAAAAKAAKIPADRMQYGPVQKWGMNPTKPAPKAPVKRTLASDAKKVAKSSKTKAAGTAVAVGAGYAKLRANDKARQQKMITIKNQWEKSAAKKSGMTLNEYIKKYGK